MAVLVTTTVNANYLVTTLDEAILVDATGGPIIITIIAPPAIGKRYHIKDSKGVTATPGGTNKIRLVTADSAKIDNATFYDLTVNKQSVTIHTDGVDWHVL